MAKGVQTFTFIKNTFVKLLLDIIHVVVGALLFILNHLIEVSG